PRRCCVSWYGSRLAMILEVLEARCGIPFAGLDVYLNVAGGLRVSEPAADLAVAAALLSAREDVALPKGTVVFGEISLSGHVRPVGQTETRLNEAQKLGFEQAILPERSKTGAVKGVRTQKMSDLASLVGDIFGAG
ncbi:MAG: DNA repair protein RadA, partial [Boseongicola sp.]|nr:DNA repair protein RadA [Boseongicola sp.]